MARIRRSRRASNPAKPRSFALHKPRGQIAQRVQAVGPEHFGVVSVDCAKAVSKFLLADFFGNVFIPPTEVMHTQPALHGAVTQVRQALQQHGLRDCIVAIERTGTYHRPVQDAFRQARFDTRLVHPFASRQFRQVADGSIKTDDTDLAGIFRAAINGFGLLEPEWPAVYQQLQLLSRHRRDLVRKTSRLRCQIREHLHALMPGYAECFDDVFDSAVALPLARQTGSAAAVRAAGLEGLRQLADAAQRRVHLATLAKVLAWADTAAPAPPQGALIRSILATLDDDRRTKTQEILRLEVQAARHLVHTPYVLLVAIPGINVVSAADLAAELGPIEAYAQANRITGRAGLMPSRYQSDQVDRPNGPLPRAGQRRLRAALMQCADNLVTHNHHFRALAEGWQRRGKNPRWIRVRVAHSFSRIAFAMVAGRAVFAHRCCQPHHAILDKLLKFHRLHETPLTEALQDLDGASQQLPRSMHADEAAPLHERLQEAYYRRRRGPQPLEEILTIVLARLGIAQVQSTAAEERDPG